MDKLIVNAEKIRGLGNILPSKSSNDFTNASSKITSTEGVINEENMTIYSVTYLNGSKLQILNNNFVEYNTGLNSFTITCKLLYHTGNVIYSAPLTCIVNENTTLTGSTNSNGECSFTIPIHEGISNYLIEIRYGGNNNVAGCTSYINICVGNIVGLDLTCDNSIIIDENTDVIATLTGTNILGETIGISGQTISFYEIGPSVSLMVSEEVLSAYHSDFCVLTATVLDAAGHPYDGNVVFMKDDVVIATVPTDSQGVATYRYAAEGIGDVSFMAQVGNSTSETVVVEDCYIYTSEEFSRTHTSTSPVSNTVINDFSFDNTNDWEFSCDFKVSGIGQRIDIVPLSENLNHHLGFGKSTDTNYLRYYIGKVTSGEYSITTSKNVTNNTYYPITVKKIGTNVIFIFEDEETINSYDSSWLSDYATETFKFTQWRANTISVKNIKIKQL